MYLAPAQVIFHSNWPGAWGWQPLEKGSFSPPCRYPPCIFQDFPPSQKSRCEHWRSWEFSCDSRHLVFIFILFYVALADSFSPPVRNDLWRVMQETVCWEFAWVAAYKLKGGLNLDHLSCAASWVQSVKPCETHTQPTILPTCSTKRSYFFFSFQPLYRKMRTSGSVCI